MKESDIQKQIIQYCRSKHKDDFFVFSIPNEAIMKIAKFVPEKIRYMMFSLLKSMGFISGLPDLIFIGKNSKLCPIELKNEDGKLTDSQKKTFAFLERFTGKIEIARSLEDVISILKKKKMIKNV